jgi:hypothetical protein
MLKVYINALILALIFCCSIGLSTYTYIGPYEVSFNSTAHPVSLITLEPYFEFAKAEKDQWDIISTTYEGISYLNNSTTQISITEGALPDTLVNDLTSLGPLKGFTKLEQINRVIDGKDATVAKYKNKTGGWSVQKAVFEFPVQFEYYEYGNDNIAVLQILGYNYTDYEFDRLLDTFRTNRLVSR